MGSYTEIFGGNVINPSQLSYISYSISADLVLVWPLEAPPDANVAADKIDILPSTTGLSVYLPPANQTSVGNDVLIRNTGAATFSVLDSAGGALGTVASGEAWYFVLKTNADAAGTWYAIQFGAATSSANAASLAGYGLRASVTQLDQNLITVPLLGDYAVTTADRASVLQNGTGAAVYTFASAATLGNGFFVYVINAGSGNLTLTPNGAQTIDGAATKVLAPTETVIIFSDGSNLHSLGYGRSLVNTVSAASIAIGGTGTYTLSSAEVAAQIQDCTGTLTGARIADYGALIGYWFVYNNTSGAYTLTARSGGLDAGVVVPQGSFTILRSNGTNMRVAFTATSGTVTSVATTSDLTGGPITTTGTLGLSNTTVTPGTYGAVSKTLGATVDAKGRITDMAQADIAIAIAQVTPFSSDDLRGRLTDKTGTGLAVFATAPTLTAPTFTNPVVGTQAPGNNSTLGASTAFVTAAIAAIPNPNIFPTGYLYGLTLSTAGSSATFGIAAGGAADSTGASIMRLASAYTKTTSAWAVGSGNGALDTGVIANSTWYHVFEIQKTDLTTVDVLISLSATSPTMPAGYTLFRRIGALQTNGSAQWVKFNQIGDDFYRLEILDYTLGGGTAIAALKTLSVPTGIVIEPFTSVVAKAINNNTAIIQYAPAADATLLFTVGYHYEGDPANGSTSNNSVIGPATNTSAQIYVAQPGAGGESQLIYTYGWRDTRGRDA